MDLPLPLQIVAEVFEKHRKTAGGSLASYIPELAKADASRFGVSIATVTGEVYEWGDARQPFTLQSVSKPFVYGLALENHGHAEVHSRVGVEPTGEAFNSIIELEKHSHRPYNPMINSGAIAMASLVPGSTGAEKLKRVLELFERYTGRAMQVDEAVYASERSTGHRNRAIAHLLKHFSVIDADIEESLDLYFQQCSIWVDARDLALMGASLANRGVQPKTGKQALPSEHVKHVLSLMFSCGMYDSAGDWAHAVGLPAKSGVSGGILAVVPGQMGIATYSPLLDSCGHSVRGVGFYKELSARLQLSVFDL